MCVAAAEMSASASGADNAVEDDDIVRRNKARLCHEVADAPLQAVAESVLGEQLRGRVLVVIRELDDRSAEGAVLEQLEGERSDTSSNVKAGSAADAHERSQVARSLRQEAASPIAARVVPREAMAKDAPVFGLPERRAVVWLTAAAPMLPLLVEAAVPRIGRGRIGCRMGKGRIINRTYGLVNGRVFEVRFRDPRSESALLGTLIS